MINLSLKNNRIRYDAGTFNELVLTAGNTTFQQSSILKSNQTSPVIEENSNNVTISSNMLMNPNELNIDFTFPLDKNCFMVGPMNINSTINVEGVLNII